MNTPHDECLPQISGAWDHSCAAPFALGQADREEMAIVDIRVAFFFCSFFTDCPRVVTRTAPQTPTGFLSVFTTTVR